MRKNILKIPQHISEKYFSRHIGVTERGEVALLAAICARIGSRKKKSRRDFPRLFVGLAGHAGKGRRKNVAPWPTLFPHGNAPQAAHGDCNGDP
jgi:hypothetical protein